MYVFMYCTFSVLCLCFNWTPHNPIVLGMSVQEVIMEFLHDQLSLLKRKPEVVFSSCLFPRFVYIEPIVCMSGWGVLKAPSYSQFIPVVKHYSRVPRWYSVVLGSA